MRFVKSLVFSLALLGFAAAPSAVFACESIGACSGGTCVVCFATSSPNGTGCAYTCKIIKSV